MNNVIDFKSFKTNRTKFAKLVLKELEDGKFSVSVFGAINGREQLVFSDVGDHPLELPVNAINTVEQQHFEVVDDELFERELSLIPFTA